MLQTPTEFPHVGSYAVFRSTKVRIQRINPNGTRLVIGQTERRKVVTATVALDQLSPWASPEDAVDLWASTRIASLGGDSFTGAVDVWADFLGWYRTIYQSEPPIDKAVLCRRLRDSGFQAAKGRTPLGSGIRNGFRFSLHAARKAAA